MFQDVSEVEQSEKLLNSGNVDRHNVLEQFPHTSATNFAILFSSEKFKRENGNF